MPYPYQSLNHLGQITNVNNKWLELTGYSKDEVINQKFSKFTDETHETLKGLFSIF
ncbi:MAG: PAS domain S-box protein [Arcobacter sp.]|nr:PAS domain S-box protein [Arcobacter sp.]